MSDYLLLETGDSILLEDSSGDLILEDPLKTGRAHDPPGPPRPQNFRDSRTSKSIGNTAVGRTRVSQEALEFITPGVVSARVSQEALEFITHGVASDRVSQIALEFITPNTTSKTYPFLGLYLSPLIFQVGS